MDESLFESIRNELKACPEVYDLRLDGRLYDLTHPKVLRAQEELKVETFNHPEWKAVFYASMTEARRYHPEIQQAISGRPSDIFRLMQDSKPALVDFGTMGVAALSKSEMIQGNSDGLHRSTMPIWLTYAMSPELWGPVGKWTRFHTRLHTLFDKFQLLQGDAVPGYYPLTSRARALENHGFLGSTDGQAFIFSMNWTFPLSALEKMEAVVAQEF